MSKDKNVKIKLMNWKENFEICWLLFLLIRLNSACHKMAPASSDLSPFCMSHLANVSSDLSAFCRSHLANVSSELSAFCRSQ